MIAKQQLHNGGGDLGGTGVRGRRSEIISSFEDDVRLLTLKNAFAAVLSSANVRRKRFTIHLYSRLSAVKFTVYSQPKETQTISQIFVMKQRVWTV